MIVMHLRPSFAMSACLACQQGWREKPVSIDLQRRKDRKSAQQQQNVAATWQLPLSHSTQPEHTHPSGGFVVFCGKRTPKGHHAPHIKAQESSDGQQHRGTNGSMKARVASHSPAPVAPSASVSTQWTQRRSTTNTLTSASMCEPQCFPSPTRAVRADCNQPNCDGMQLQSACRRRSLAVRSTVGGARGRHH